VNYREMALADEDDEDERDSDEEDPLGDAIREMIRQ
jgi:hypothetical protein